MHAPYSVYFSLSMRETERVYVPYSIVLIKWTQGETSSAHKISLYIKIKKKINK